MSKFNKKSLVAARSKTVNLAGGEAFKESPELELASLLLTSFVEDKFYETKNEQLKRLGALVDKLKDKTFAGKAAIYARTEFGMRSITHALVGEIVQRVKGQEWTKRAIDKTIFRVDDALEMMAYYGNKYGKPFPNALKKGISLGLAKFDEYQLAKYKGEGKDVKLVDLLNLVHPKPVRGQAKAFKALIAGSLKNTKTWEAKLSEAGQVEAETKEEREAKVAKNKAKAWQTMLESDKLGYFALLRNVRNIMDQAPEMVDLMCEKLVDKKAIKKSLILPFQFKKAYDAVLAGDGKRKVMKALDTALNLSVSNCPKFDGKTLIVLDRSGSMSGKPSEIGELFMAALAKSQDDADLMVFADRARYFKVNPNSLISDIIGKIPCDVGGGTDFHSIFRALDTAYDRIVILSDMQGWVGYGAPTQDLKNYKSKFKCDPYIYSFDLNGYGTLQFPASKVFAIAGFSDKTLSLMKLLEEDRNVLVNKIKEIEL